MSQLFRITNLDEVASTNDVVKCAIDEGESEGFVCRARVQTGGYGRQGRLWSSPEGGLYQSILLRPNVEPALLSTLALVSALAVRAAVLELSGISASAIQVKWPNDVLAIPPAATDASGAVASGKLAGISCEVYSHAICLGIGVNVLHQKTAVSVSVSGKNQPAYFADIAPSICAEADVVDRLGDAVLEALEAYYLRWQHEGFAAFAEEFAACSYLTGRQVRIADIQGNIATEGIAMGIDEHGCLLVSTATGTATVVSGEAHLI